MLYEHFVSFLFPYVFIHSLSSLFCLCFSCWWLHQLLHTSCAAPAAAHLQHLGDSAAADIIWFSYHLFSHDMSIIISSSFTITPSYHIIIYLLMIFHHRFYHFIISFRDFSIITSSLLTLIALHLILVHHHLHINHHHGSSILIIITIIFPYML